MQNESALKTLFGQLVRFGLVGVFSTILYAAIYWPLATYVVHPVLAVFIAFSIAVAIGYVLHSSWSFRGHGRGSEGGLTQAKFLSVQSVGMVLNAIFTWVLTGPIFDGPTWWPLVPAVLVTPLVTFVLNRWWVFG